jgi:hypothetical protein
MALSCAQNLLQDRVNSSVSRMQLGIKPAPHRRLRLCAGDDPVTDPVTEFFNTDRRVRKDELSLVDQTLGTLSGDARLG